MDSEPHKTAMPGKFVDQISKSLKEQAYEKLTLERELNALEGAKDNRRLKKWYAIALLVMLFLQLIAVYILTFLDGLSVINLDGAKLETVVTATLIETASLVYVIVKNLFPQI